MQFLNDDRYKDLISKYYMHKCLNKPINWTNADPNSGTGVVKITLPRPNDFLI